MYNNEQKGKVIFGGAGPGDPELITLKLSIALQKADVIITDRLVNSRIIEKYARPVTKIVTAGKQGYNDASISQEEINQMLVRYASEGYNVLRLKGGDVAFFSNVLDEIKVLLRNKIPFEIIPGITAASGASAYTGIPLTAREYSQGVQFITFNPKSFYSPERWRELARSNDTLVFYMAAKNIFGLTELLLRYSRKTQTPLAVIEQATTIYQKVHITTLKDCVIDFSGKSFSSPSLVIVGDVVSLYQDFKWFETSEQGSIFQALKQ